MRGELREIQRSVGITTVFVTHDQTEALGLSDRIAVMQGGRIEQLAAPREIYERPATRFVADFIGASSLRGRAIAPHRVELGPGLVLRVEAELAEGRDGGAGDPARTRRGRALRGLRADANAVGGRIVALTYLGARVEVSVELPGGQRVLAL